MERPQQQTDMAKRPCASPGCPRLVKRGQYCEDHAQYSAPKRNDRVRGGSAKRGYDYRWQRYSAERLRLYPLCADPDNRHPGVVEAAELTDHIIPVSGPDDPLFWDRTNHQSLSRSCHSYKTAKEDGGFGNKSNGIKDG